MSYRDVLARSERRRPDGSPVWPLTDADLPTATLSRAAVARMGQDPQGLGAQHDRASRRARHTNFGGTNAR